MQRRLKVVNVIPSIFVDSTSCKNPYHYFIMVDGYLEAFHAGNEICDLVEFNFAGLKNE